jgi:ribonuclease Z
MAAYGRFPSSQLLQNENDFILIDCGEGTQFQLQKYKLRYHKINHILISHLHGDHYLGLVGLISSLNLQGRKNELHIYAPRELSEIILTQLKYSKTVLNFELIFNPLSKDRTETILETKTLIIKSFPLYHRIQCLGFRFDEKIKARKIIKEKIPHNIKIEEIQKLKEGKDVFKEDGTIKFKFSEFTTEGPTPLSFAYCSDTRFNLSIVNEINNVDLLYHEATFLHELVERAKSTFHSTAKEAGIIAKEANAGKLMIGHFSARYKDLNVLLIEAKIEFKETILAHEGETISITKS